MSDRSVEEKVVYLMAVNDAREIIMELATIEQEKGNTKIAIMLAYCSRAIAKECRP